MGKSGKFKDTDLAMLCHQFSLVLKSGVHPVEGIPLVIEDTGNPALKKTLARIADGVEHGDTLYKAFSDAGGFPTYMLAMIRVGEQTGMLESVMDGLSSFYENQADIRKKIRSAVSYPVILAVLMLGVIALITAKVIPMFIDILTSLGGQIPKQVDFFIGLGNMLKDGFIYPAAALLVLIAILLLLARVPGFRFFADRLKFVNPFTGGIYKKIIASRFSGAMAMTLRNGMSMVEGFQIVSGVLDNRYAVMKTREASKAVNAGKSFSDSIRETKLFPALFARLVKTGEKTGSLDAMMEKISHTYRDEVDTSLRRLIGFIEPVCVTVLSLILAGVLLSVILPLINIMSSIG